VRCSNYRNDLPCEERERLCQNEARVMCSRETRPRSRPQVAGSFREVFNPVLTGGPHCTSDMTAVIPPHRNARFLATLLWCTLTLPATVGWSSLTI
jgi:hypothetical protein